MQQIEPHIPVFDKGERGDDRLSRSPFAYDAANDRYTCPEGKPLQQYRAASRAAKATPPKDDLYRYFARKHACLACPLKPLLSRNAEQEAPVQHPRAGA